MKFDQAIPLQEIVDFLQVRLIGQPDLMVGGINEIHKVDPGDLTFVDFHKYYKQALHSHASVILIDCEMACPEGKALLLSEDPFRDYNKLARKFRPARLCKEPDERRYHLCEDTEISKEAVIMPGVFVGNHVRIGAGSVIHPNVVLYDYTEIGENVTIHANTSIGGDAFYYKHRKEWDPPRYEKMHPIGKVVIGNDVEIGCNCSIDRGVSGVTRIGQGTKIDNQVMLGHGVVIGEHCLIAAQVGIAGKTILGDRVIVWAQAGISAKLKIGDGAIILAQSGVNKDLEGGKIYFGAPAIEARQAWKDIANIRRLRKQ